MTYLFFAKKYRKVAGLNFILRLDVGCRKLYTNYVKFNVDHNDSM